MRRMLGLIVVVTSIALVIPCFAALPPVTNGLVGCWNFDEGSLVTAMDMSGNGNNGTVVNATYASPPSGTLSTASLYFNNSGHPGYAYSYVTIPDSSSLRPSSGLTLAAWVKTNSTEGHLRHIVSKQYGGALGDSFVIWYHDDGRLWFACSVGYVDAERPSANQWHHIVATYNGSLMRLYVDGVESGSTPATGSLSYDDSPVLIGADCNNADHIPDGGWVGEIDEVLIYNRGLSQAEVATLTGFSRLYGIIGSHLVTVNLHNGRAAEVGVINATELWAMTYDTYTNALYCVVNQTTDPVLVVINQTSATAETIGPIDLDGQPPTYLGLVESLAFNPVDGILYGSAGTAPPYSNMLIRIDPATGEATQIASITGTPDDDGDSLVFVNGTLYLVDSTPYSDLYTLNLDTGVATFVGDLNDFRHVVLAYDPETQTLLGSAGADRFLFEISPSNGQCTDIGPTHTAGEFEGALLGPIAVVFDGRTPDIGIPIQDPLAENVQPYQNVTVSVSVADSQSGVKNVTLSYSLDNSTVLMHFLTMNHNATTGLYETAIPGQPAGTWVKYKIVAFDQTGNSATLEGELPYLSYEVIPEFPLFPALLICMTAMLMATIVYRKRLKA